MALPVFDAAPEVAPANHNADLYAFFHAALDCQAYGSDKVKIIPGMLFSGERLSADLYDDTLKHSVLSFPIIVRILPYRTAESN